jgi:hypothetical protein
MRTEQEEPYESDDKTTQLRQNRKFCFDCGDLIRKEFFHPLFSDRCQPCGQSYEHFERDMEEILCVDCGGGSNGWLYNRRNTLCGFCAIPYVVEQIELLLLDVGVCRDVIALLIEYVGSQRSDVVLSTDFS